jgi:hypothetical protein
MTQKTPKDAPTAQELLSLRLEWQLSRAEMATALGYGGPQRDSSYAHIESGARLLTSGQGLLVASYKQLIAAGYRPNGWPSGRAAPAHGPRSGAPLTSITTEDLAECRSRLASIRVGWGLSQADMGAALGYAGPRRGSVYWAVERLRCSADPAGFTLRADKPHGRRALTVTHYLLIDIYQQLMRANIRPATWPTTSKVQHRTGSPKRKPTIKPTCKLDPLNPMAEVEALKAYKAHKQAISDAARVKYYEIKAAREAKAATTQKEVS